MTILMDIDHEANSLAEWTSTVTDGGDLSAAAGAALAGTNYGMSVLINDVNEKSATAGLAAPTTNLRYRFYFDPNSVTVPDWGDFRFMHLVETSGDYVTRFKINLRYIAGEGYHLMPSMRDDNDSVVFNDDEIITDAPHYIEVSEVCAASSSSNDGTIEWWIDGVSKGSATGLDNYVTMRSTSDFTVGTPLGTGAGISGTFYLDQFVVNDTGAAIGAYAASTSTPMTLTGASTPSGSVAKGIGETKTGSITPSGTVAKRIGETKTGSITPSGALNYLKSALASFAGSITPTGSLTHLKARVMTLVGSITPSGPDAYTTDIYRTSTGGVVPTGALPKSNRRTKTGSITPTGTDVKSLPRTKTGSITPAGSFLRSFLHPFGGGITPGGNLISFAGTFFKSLLGTLTPSGTLSRKLDLARLLQGVLTPTGKAYRNGVLLGISTRSAFVLLFRKWRQGRH